jgi:hypothetical protein
MAYFSLTNPKKYRLSEHNRALKILNDYGWQRSKAEYAAIDKDGQPIPWITYPAIEYLNQINLQDKRILEWGSGNSSQYFATRCNEIYSIEHNKEWFDSLQKNLLQNQKLFLSTLENYATFPSSLGLKFDIIIIDGMLRKECVDASFDLIEQGGMILLDNSERYPDMCETIRNKSYFQIDFHGFGPINEYTSVTSIFISSDSIGKFQPLTVQPRRPIGGDVIKD